MARLHVPGSPASRAGAALAALAVLALPAGRLHAFDLDPPGWRDATTAFNIQIPGQFTTFSGAFSEALDLWTDSTVFAFTKIMGSVDPCQDPNAVEPANGVKFDSVDCSDDFGETTLAVTRTWTDATRRLQSGIVFNTAFSWDVYNGSWRSGLADFRRVAVHELGHVIGLGHSINLPAVMEAVIRRGSTVEVPQPDDIDGVATLYGFGEPPANDDFSDAIMVSGLPGFADGVNFSASTEPGEPVHANAVATGASVWWRWTAPESGAVSVSTFGSRFDTVLAVYTGSDLAALEAVAGNDDFGTEFSSRDSFEAVAGETYRIAVAGVPGAVGSISLSILPDTVTASPANDSFAGAIPLSGLPVTAVGNSIGATREAGELLLDQSGGGASVWWRWTAPADSVVTFSTQGSQFDSMLGVFTGDSVDALTEIKSQDDVDPGVIRYSRFAVSVSQGQTYRIAVDGWDAQTGPIYLALTSDRPVNDDFAAAAAVLPLSQAPGAFNFFAEGSNLGATKEPGEPDHAGLTGGSSVWWTWTAPLSGLGVVGALDGDFDTVVGVYTGDSVSGLVEVGANDDSSAIDGFDSLVLFPVTEGQNYKIAVDGFANAAGDITILVSGLLMPNDIVLNLGPPLGVWAYLNDSTMVQINAANPNKIVLADVDGDSFDEVIADFGPDHGLWIREETGVWSRFNVNTTTHMAVGDLDGNDKDDVITDFGPGIGTWVKMNGTTWQQLNVNSTGGIVTADLDNSGQDEAILDLGPEYGLWAKFNDDTWKQIHAASPKHMVAGGMDKDIREELVIDLGSDGIWLLPNNTEWEIIHGSTGEGMALSDVDADADRELFVDFGPGQGLWMREQGNVWTKIHDSSPNAMAGADVDSDAFDELVADFGPGAGTWIYRNGSWSQLNEGASSVIATGNMDGK